MEVRKVLRKATAIAASASFIGATMLGAMAQDLATYPAPFVKDGKFDAFIVVGEKAAAEDVVGAVDVGTSLQFALKKATTVSAGAAEATIDSGVKIQKSGDKFNYEDSIAGIEQNTAITADDLPTALADGKYVESEGANKNSVTYTQKLLFNQTGTAKLIYGQDDTLAPKAGDYLFLNRGTNLYNYTLEFDSGVVFDNTSSTNARNDLKTSTIAIQGQTYTITDVALNGGKISQLNLLSGEAVLWLTQNNPITKTINGVDHKVEVLDVTDAADACQVKVDDVTAIINTDETKVVNGVQIGVTDVRAIHAQLQDVDVCQLSVGASEVDIVDGDNVKVDSTAIDGTTGSIAQSRKSSGTAALDKVSIVYDGSNWDDDQWLAPGKEFIDPIFKSWKLVYGGLTADYETETLKRSGGKTGSFTFVNNDGKTVELPIFMNKSATIVGFGDGEDVDKKLYASGNGITNFSTVCHPSSNDSNDCKGMQILASTSGGEAHVFEITKVTNSKNQTDIKDLTYGRTFSDVDYNAEQNFTVPLGSFGTIVLNITPQRITLGTTVNQRIETNAHASLTLAQEGAPADSSINFTNTYNSGANVTINVSELNRNNAADIPDEQAPSSAVLRAKADTTNTQIDVFGNLYGQLEQTGVDQDVGSDLSVQVSRVGTKLTADTNNNNVVTVEVPKSEVFGNVFVAPIAASVSTAAGGTATYTLSKLNVGAAKLDSEISDVGANNLIVVGGPCANKVAATVLGKTFPACGADSGIDAGTAVLQEVVQSSGKVALVAAGYDAADTRRATKVLGNYDTYQLSGAKVIVTGTSLTDIQVKKSA